MLSRTNSRSSIHFLQHNSIIICVFLKANQNNAFTHDTLIYVSELRTLVLDIRISFNCLIKVTVCYKFNG